MRGLWKVFGPRPERIVGSADADLPRAELAAKHGQHRRHARHLPRCRAGRGVRRDGVVGFGQIDIGPLPHPSHRTDRWHGSHRRHRRHRRRRRDPARCAAPPGEHGLPAVRSTAAPQPHRQRGVRARGARPGQDLPAGHCGGHARTRRPARARQRSTRAAVRWHAATGRARPRSGDESGHHVVRRTVLGARPADPARHAGRGRAAPQGGPQDHGVHHPRPQRGTAARRPDRDHARRSFRPGGNSRGGGRLTGRRLRPQLRARRAALARRGGRVDHGGAERHRPLRHCADGAPRCATSCGTSSTAPCPSASSTNSVRWSASSTGSPRSNVVAGELEPAGN